MRKLALFTLLFVFALAIPNSTHAQGSVCNSFSISPSPLNSGENFTLVKSNGMDPNAFIRVEVTETNDAQSMNCLFDNPEPPACSDRSITNLFTFSSNNLFSGNTYRVEINYNDSVQTSVCTLNLTVIDEGTPSLCQNQGISSVSPSSGDGNTFFTFSGCVGVTNPCDGRARVGILNGLGQPAGDIAINNSGAGNSCQPDGTFSVRIGNFPPGPYTAQLGIMTGLIGPIVNFGVDFDDGPSPGDFCEETRACTTSGNQGSRTCQGFYVNDQNNNLFCSLEDAQCTQCSFCGDNICTNQEIQSGCELDCRVVAPSTDYLCDDNVSLKTAIGCIPFTVISDTVKFFLRWAIGVGGGIALLFIIYASLQIITSSGNPDKLQEGRDMLTSTIVGILMTIFSIFLLRIIGVNILGIF